MLPLPYVRCARGSIVEAESFLTRRRPTQSHWDAIFCCTIVLATWHLGRAIVRSILQHMFSSFGFTSSRVSSGPEAHENLAPPSTVERVLRNVLRMMLHPEERSQNDAAS